MEISKTHRGFDYFTFYDSNCEKCSIQRSSSLMSDYIWIGINDANPQILASKTKSGGTGWVKYDVPDEVLMTTRMHLSRDKVAELLPILQRFVESGEIT